MAAPLSSYRICPVFFSYFSQFLPHQKYENTSAPGKTKGRGPARPAVAAPLSSSLVFFPYFSRIFRVVFSYFCRGGPAAKIREKYERSRKNERARAGPSSRIFLACFLYFSRIYLVFFCIVAGAAVPLSSSRIFLVVSPYFSRIVAGAGPQQKYEQDTRIRALQEKREGEGRPGRPWPRPSRALVFSLYFSRMFLVLFL